jgi:hypothetical protein
VQDREIVRLRIARRCVGEMPLRTAAWAAVDLTNHNGKNGKPAVAIIELRTCSLCCRPRFVVKVITQKLPSGLFCHI